jgi:hypothetical protein
LKEKNIQQFLKVENDAILEEISTSREYPEGNSQFT